MRELDSVYQTVFRTSDRDLVVVVSSVLEDVQIGYRIRSECIQQIVEGAVAGERPRLMPRMFAFEVPDCDTERARSLLKPFIAQQITR